MKKIIALTLCFVIMFSLGNSSFAEGVAGLKENLDSLWLTNNLRKNRLIKWRDSTFNFLIKGGRDTWSG